MRDLVCTDKKINIQICAIFVIDKVENDPSLFKMKGINDRKLFFQDQLHLQTGQIRMPNFRDTK